MTTTNSSEVGSAIALIVLGIALSSASSWFLVFVVAGLVILLRSLARR